MAVGSTSWLTGQALKFGEMIENVFMAESLAQPIGGRVAESPAAFGGLLVDHQLRIFNYLKSLVRNHHEAEDLLQRTNLVLWRKRESFEAGSNFHAWSLSIARLEALNQIRQLRRDQRVFSDEPGHLAADENAPAPFSGGVDDEALVALNACLKRLAPRDQELLLMRYGSSQTLNDYAKVINRHPGTLKARLFKIRENLRRDIRELLQSAGDARAQVGVSRDRLGVL